MKKILLTLFGVLLLMPTAYADRTDVGQWEQEDATTIKVRNALNVHIEGDLTVDGAIIFGGGVSGDIDMGGYDLLNTGNVQLVEASGCDATSGTSGFGVICGDTDGSAYYINGSGAATALGGLTIGGSALDDSIITADGTGGNVQYSTITITSASNIAGVDQFVGVGDSNSSFALGDSTTISASASQSTVTGVSADILGSNATGYGYNVQAGINSAVVGTNASNTAGLGSGIGYGITVSSNGVNVGTLSSTTGTSAAFGRSAVAAAGQVVFGSSTFSYKDLYLGQGTTAPSPDAQASVNATSGSGTNVHASDMVIRPGASTGNAATTDVIIQTTTAGSSGATVQTYKDTLKIRDVIETDSDFYVNSSSKGIVLKSPDGTCARGTIDNSDVLTFASITCP